MVRPVAIIAGALCAALLSACGPGVACGDPATDPKAADYEAWKMFASINRKAARKSQDAQWERWAEAGYVFQGTKPVWPPDSPQLKILEPLFQNTSDFGTQTGAHDMSSPTPPVGSNSEVRLNR